MLYHWLGAEAKQYLVEPFYKERVQSTKHVHFSRHRSSFCCCCSLGGSLTARHTLDRVLFVERSVLVTRSGSQFWCLIILQWRAREQPLRAALIATKRRHYQRLFFLFCQVLFDCCNNQRSLHLTFVDDGQAGSTFKST